MRYPEPTHVLEYRVAVDGDTTPYSQIRWQAKHPVPLRPDFADPSAHGLPGYDFRASILKYQASRWIEARHQAGLDIPDWPEIPLAVWNATGGDLRQARHKVAALKWLPIVPARAADFEHYVWSKQRNMASPASQLPADWFNFSIIPYITDCIQRYEGQNV